MATTQGGWIKLSRKILDWRWYHDANTFRVFLHLLLKANINDHDFERETIHRGELATSYASLAADLELTPKQVRVSIQKLKETGEVALRRHSRFLVISMPNYDFYQGAGQSQGTQKALAGHSQGNQRATIKEYKELEEGEEYARTRATPMESSESGWVTYRWEDLTDDDDDERTE